MDADESNPFLKGDLHEDVIPRLHAVGLTGLGDHFELLDPEFFGRAVEVVMSQVGTQGVSPPPKELRERVAVAWATLTENSKESFSWGTASVVRVWCHHRKEALPAGIEPLRSSQRGTHDNAS